MERTTVRRRWAPLGEDAFERAAAEFVGVFMLVFVGAGSIMLAGQTNLLAIAFAHGLAIAVMASAVGHISGAHFNPAITVGFLLTRRMEPFLGALYIVTQLAGALLAALVLRWIYPPAARDPSALGAPIKTGAVDVWQAMTLEAILTFFLVWVVFATAADPRGTFKSIAGLAIGLTITADILMAGPITGAAMNPARAFGPQLVQREWADAWIWYVGPLLGGAAAALAYELLYLRPLRPAPVGPPETGVIEPRPGDAALS